MWPFKKDIDNKCKKEPKWKIKDGELYFRYYSSSDNKSGYDHWKYRILDCINLGSATDEYDPYENLAAFFVDKNIPREWEQIMIKRMRKQIKESDNSVKDYDRKVKTKYKYIKLSK